MELKDFVSQLSCIGVDVDSMPNSSCDAQIGQWVTTSVGTLFSADHLLKMQPRHLV